ncbi:Gem-associated protein 7 [Aphelenchoides avenae]|nr:Gem-associated protein 7 [Aphelenchus avenae]
MTEGPGTSSATTPSIDEQKANAELRERYLRLIASIGGKEVELRMFERMTLKGTYVALQRSGEHYVVDALTTPTGVVEHAALR